VTAANLALGLAASAVVVALAPALARGNVPAWPVGLGALLAWQVSYALDCADGQLARVTGRATAAGARLDVLGDVAVQAALVAAVAAVAAAYRPGTPAWLLAAFGATWMVNPVAAVLQSGPRAASLVPSPARPVRLLKMVRDYGAVILALGLLLTFAPQWMVVAVWFFTVVNAGFLFASIGAAARTSAQRNGPDQTTER
jgi:phosphatidylglycerophosphate synthase